MIPYKYNDLTNIAILDSRLNFKMEDDDTDLTEPTLKDEEISFIDDSLGQSSYKDSTDNKIEHIPDVRVHLASDELMEESDTLESEATDRAYNKDSTQQMNQRHRLSSSERSNTLADDLSYIPPPKVNCPEKIVRIDVSNV